MVYPGALSVRHFLHLSAHGGDEARRMPPVSFYCTPEARNTKRQHRSAQLDCLSRVRRQLEHVHRRKLKFLIWLVLHTRLRLLRLSTCFEGAGTVERDPLCVLQSDARVNEGQIFPLGGARWRSSCVLPGHLTLLHATLPHVFPGLTYVGLVPNSTSAGQSNC